MQYQHPQWTSKYKRGGWRKIAGPALVVLLLAAGAYLAFRWLRGVDLPLPGFPARTPPSFQATILPAPPPESEARAFLDGWRSGEYSGMYALLADSSRETLPEEQFADFYRNVHLQATVRSLDYEIVSVDMTPTDATVEFEVTLHTILVGDIVERTRVRLQNRDGGWGIVWDGETVLPQLKEGYSLVMHREEQVRGGVYDRNGIALAAEAEAVDIGVVPGEIGDEDGVLAALSAALKLPREAVRQLYADAAPEEYVPIGDASAEELGNRLAQLQSYGGVYLSTYTTRYYYEGGVGAHVVGYLRKISPEMLDDYRAEGYSGAESVGAAGLERSAEQDLAGKPGGRLLVTAPDGSTVEVLAEAAGRPAMDIRTTLDGDAQAQIERTVLGPYNGAVVVLNRDTGEVLAMASSKRYDSNLFSTGSTNGIYLLGGLLADEASPLTNRATNGLYPLGSVFKIITMAAGLESGLVAADSIYDDTDGYYYGCDGFVGKDWTVDKDLPPQGKLTLEQCLMRSCNPCFWHLGEELYNLDPGRVPDMARAFGLGSATGIPGLDESAGQVPDNDWKVENEGVGWSCGDALNQAIGQGALQVTPLQAADFTAAVGNGGTLYRPQVVLSIGPAEGEPVFSFAPAVRGTLPLQPFNLQVIQRAMRAVVNDPKGTAYAKYYVIRNTVKIAGKTGTAETGTDLPHSWFVAYTFNEAPNKPDIAVAVIAEFAGEGSDYAARMARRVIEIFFLGRPSALYPWEATYGLRGTDTPTETPEGYEQPEEAETPEP
jgi:penicillin-binding protein 2